MSQVREGLRGRWRRVVEAGRESLLAVNRGLSRVLMGYCVRALVYVADAEATFAPKTVLPLDFRALAAEELESLHTTHVDFKEKQLRRLERFGESHAYGVFLNGELTHVSWLLPPDAMRVDSPHVISGGPGEAEITGCETLPEFRGLGIYPFAIQNLTNTAHELGYQRVYMKTAGDNVASQRGIEKAGLHRLGSAIIIQLPFTDRKLIWRRYG